MTERRRSSSVERVSRRQPATTPEERELQLILAAQDLAERQIRDGTASAQVISHYLKLGSSRERLEQQLMAQQAQLVEAKIENLASAARVEELYGRAISAMREYAGYEEPGGAIIEGEYYD